MYNNGSFAGGTLAATGVAFDALWMLMTAFALFALMLAMGRILPKRGLR